MAGKVNSNNNKSFQTKQAHPERSLIRAFNPLKIKLKLKVRFVVLVVVSARFPCSVSLPPLGQSSCFRGKCVGLDCEKGNALD